MRYPKELTDFLDGRSPDVSIYKSGPATRAITALELLDRGRFVALAVTDASELSRMRGLLTLLRPPGEAPVWERPWLALPAYPPGPPVPGDWARRMAVLYALAERPGPRILLFTVDNLLPKWPGRDLIASHHHLARPGDEMLIEMLLEQAVSWGYARSPMVGARGEVAVRGDILDIFPPGYGWPVRFEFFGDTLESLRLFDPATQRSQGELESVTVLPVTPAPATPALFERAKAHWATLAATGELDKAARGRLEEGLSRGECAVWPGMFHAAPTALSQWFPPDAAYVLSKASLLRPRIEERAYSWREYFGEEPARGLGFARPWEKMLWPEAQAWSSWRGAPQALFEELALAHEKRGPDMAEKAIEDFSQLFWKPEEQKRPWAALVAALKDWRTSRERVILSFHSAKSRSKFLALAAREELGFATGLAPGERGLFALVSPLSQGMEACGGELLILPEDVLQPSAGASEDRQRKAKAFKGLSKHDDLREGDLLVHRDYGLARFAGLSRLRVGQVANDYLLLVFDGDDKLYLPADRIGLAARYKGPESQVAALDKLGGARWKAAKEKARKAIEKIAQDLIEMYAYRRVAKGYSYGRVDDAFWEFEAGFGFEETEDQDRAIAETLADMERPEPMDRLVCGDVGFGKTEVAMRAAFRAVLDGKQVALLCPTTILAEQHYQNFKARMDAFAVRVGMLSRFVSAKDQKMELDSVRRGETDILIGTHRLLSKDVEFPRLGLLILDEEQRFGVSHKEKIKKMRRTIDALTLTATPIPRTLQLSLSGIRSLSVIETPPVDRKPVENALIERDPDMLGAIVARELERGGQVFWVHNRVSSLPGVVDFIRSIAPGARVGMAHGQMAESELEKAMHEFWHAETQILACTAIIESGLDFPKANTLIVDQAQMFGLGQLYQLRGRVGRSDRQAYAYFLVPSLREIPETAAKRLKIILDMDFLGAGFHLAMEDLRLRGAGNILGEAQSGSIARVGLDMYLELLDQEVRRLKGEKLVTRAEPEALINFAARLPESYVPETGERLRLYRQLSAAEDLAEIDARVLELRDRYGPPPEEALNFIGLIRLKRRLAALSVSKAELSPARMVLSWDEEAAGIDLPALLTFVENAGDMKLSPPAKLEARLAESHSVEDALNIFSQRLEAMARAGVVPGALEAGNGA
ncbi:MAG: transcription-repair coupling factor [Desulfovibrionaceae bacterium]|nr:transcription-repair coupling factor [Desulfovibrionaceae bacterium]MBF0513603.1 transcription-repair coupling factor [Desulfovibrionaceae bacterium]